MAKNYLEFITLKLEIFKHEEETHTAGNNFESKEHGILNLSFSIAVSVHVLWVPGKTVPK